jgi:hypothetical protein
MEGMALSLGLKASYFADRYTKDPLVLFRIFHYPRDTRPVEEPCWGVGEHTDYGVLTILKQDAAGGLQVKSRSRWIAAPPISGTSCATYAGSDDGREGIPRRHTGCRVRPAAVGSRFRFSLVPPSTPKSRPSSSSEWSGTISTNAGIGPAYTSS